MYVWKGEGRGQSIEVKVVNINAAPINEGGGDFESDSDEQSTERHR